MTRWRPSGRATFRCNYLQIKEGYDTGLANCVQGFAAGDKKVDTWKWMIAAATDD
jgi:hypothetical protein